ncbi:hypothetical protein EDB81DRAFT_659697 [Dactylonectria macrodidyma]|uniref:Rhodopsin domain-containing protein n=1 Tax=Dactylonectria macrodidyma TaxID=307937 RepID=A0A9P9E9A5_9HYPO|nr:hypothetical protein EDB81DRAFT_659697 [Dactylonectria macrodidyma]
MSNFAIEIFILLSIGLSVLGIRICVRLETVYGKKLALDDYFTALAVPLYLVEIALAHAARSHLGGLANHGMSDAERARLGASGEEHTLRVLGSQIYLAGWVVHVSLLWTLKAAMCSFCSRLARNLGACREPIYAGFALLYVTWIATFLSIMLSCRPLSRNWQISPDPGNSCQPAVAKIDLLVTTVLDELTNAYLLSIIVLMLPHMRLSLLKKLELITVSVCGAFVMTAGILRCVLAMTSSSIGIEQAERWAVREAFAAIVTVNMPIIYPFIVRGLRLLRNRNRPKGIPGLPRPNPPFFPNDGVIWVTNEFGVGVGIEIREGQGSVIRREDAHECICQTPDITGK